MKALFSRLHRQPTLPAPVRERFKLEPRAQGYVAQFLNTLEELRPAGPAGSNESLAVLLKDNADALVVRPQLNGQGPAVYLTAPNSKGESASADWARVGISRDGKLGLLVNFYQKSESERFTDLLTTVEHFDQRGLTDSQNEAKSNGLLIGSGNQTASLFIQLNRVAEKFRDVLAESNQKPAPMLDPNKGASSSLLTQKDKLAKRNVDGGDDQVLLMLERIIPKAIEARAQKGTGIMSREEFTAQNIGANYLPDLLDRYLRIAPNEAGTRVVLEGKTARSLMLQSLAQFERALDVFGAKQESNPFADFAQASLFVTEVVGGQAP